ncbi:hypothetical protein GCM10023149_47620 [Mucilaginibacter gynuensis]|uniref:Uncharacterized protein n=1 Tax=Mucilaginibacter gynuensis TaxID=1302236 RepID=A0ABP8HDN8_9SPHI
MKKHFSLIAVIAMAVIFSAFTFQKNIVSPKITVSHVRNTADSLDLGYFVVAGQEYHAYGNPAAGSNVTQIYATNNATSADVTACTNVTGTWNTTSGPGGDGLGLNVRFRHNGVIKAYSGIVYY